MTLREKVQEINLKEILKKKGEEAIEIIVTKIDEKNMRGTGALRESVRQEVSGVMPLFEALIYMKTYGVYHSIGVPPEKIPYEIGSRGKGGTSLYIQGLYAYWRNLGLDEKEAKSAAFALATLQKKFGAPLSWYQRFKRGSNFIKEAVAEIEKNLKDISVVDFTNPIKRAVKEYITDSLRNVGEIQVEI